MLAISCDSRLTLAAWKQAMDFRVRLVSDFWPHGRIGATYGVFDERLGVHGRSTFVVDRAGLVRDVVHQPELSKPREVEGYLDLLAGL